MPMRTLLRGASRLAVDTVNVDDEVMRPDQGQPSSDDTQLEEACLFLAVLACFVCCCFSTCAVRRLRRLSGYSARYLSAELTQPLLESTPETDHELVFRGEDSAWSCPICSLENRSNSTDCEICGLSKTRAAAHFNELEAKALSAAGLPQKAAVQQEPVSSWSSLLPGFPSSSDLEGQEEVLIGLDSRQRRAARRRRWRRVLSDGRLGWRLAEGAVESEVLTAVVASWDADRPGALTLLPAHEEASPEQVKKQELKKEEEESDEDEVKEEEAGDLWSRYDAAHLGTKKRKERAAELAEVSSRRSFAEKHLWVERELEKFRVPTTEGYVRLEVRRSQLLEDSLQQLVALESKALRQWMRVQFVDEPGIDVGGLEREWFQLATAAMLDVQVGVFASSPVTGELTPEPRASLPEALGGHARSRELFEFAGRLMGKAILEHVPLNCALALPVLKQLLGYPMEFEDLEALDPELFRNLEWLLALGKKQGSLEKLELDFSVAMAAPAVSCVIIEQGDDRAKDLVLVPCSSDDFYVVRELVPNGRHERVDSLNLKAYVCRLWAHHALEANRDALWHMARGLYAVVPPSILSVLDAHELQLVLCGTRTVDVEDWRAHTEYAGEYRRRGAKHAVIQWFWRCVRSLSAEDRARLLQFCTGSARVPCHGFRALQRNDGKYQRFCIQSLPRSELRFPRAHTCFNRLDLPMYSSKEELDAGLKVLIAMDATGFTMD